MDTELSHDIMLRSKLRNRYLKNDPLKTGQHINGKETTV